MRSKIIGMAVASLLSVNSALAADDKAKEAKKETPKIQTAKSGDNVAVYYKGTLEDGSVFDTNMGKAPFVFTVGKGDVIKGFDKAIVGMKEGEEKTVHIEAKNAYGVYDDKKVFDIDKSKMPDDAKLKVGQFIQVNTPNGTRAARVSSITEKLIKLDMNHVLAGKDLNFEIVLDDVQKQKASKK